MQRKYFAQYRAIIDLVEPIPLRILRPFRFTVREYFGHIEELMDSIRRVGLLQPIIVRPSNESFEVVAGHRRLEACRRLRWKQIPAIVKDLGDKEAFEICVSENVQRSTLNPIEEAKAFKSYVEEHRWGSISQLAIEIGKSEPYVSHRILLLRLPEEILAKIGEGSLSPSIGRELVWLNGEQLQQQMVRVIEENGFSVRQSHRLAAYAKSGIEVSEAANWVRLGVTPPNEDNEPDFLVKRGSNENIGAGLTRRSDERSKLKTLEGVILILRMTLIRMDEQVEKSKSRDVRDFLVEQRFAVHSLIDSCVRRKKEIELEV